VTEPPKPANRPEDAPRPLPFAPATGQGHQPPTLKDRPRRAAPTVNSDRDRYWPRDAPIRWGALFGGAMKQATLIVAVVVHLALGVVLVADLGLGMGPAAHGGAFDWLLALAYAGLTVVVVRSWLFFSWWVIAGPVATIGLLAWDGRAPFG
jgi:hypothetical protein